MDRITISIKQSFLATLVLCLGVIVPIVFFQNARTARAEYDPYATFDIVIADNFVYAIQDGRLVVVDITDRLDPRLVKEVTLIGYARALTRSGNFLFVATNSVFVNGRFKASGFHVLDISDRSNIRLVRTIEIQENASPFSEAPADVYDIEARGNNLFIGAQCGVFIYDLTDPSSPTLVGKKLGMYALSLATVQGYAFIGTIGLKILDTSVPANPDFVGEIPSDGERDYLSLAATDKYLYVPDWDWYEVDYGGGNISSKVINERITVYDVHSPRQPRRVGFIKMDVGGAPITLTAQGRYLFAKNQDGLHVIDVSDPKDPKPISLFTEIDHQTAVAIAGDYAYFAGAAQGVGVLSL